MIYREMSLSNGWRLDLIFFFFFLMKSFSLRVSTRWRSWQTTSSSYYSSSWPRKIYGWYGSQSTGSITGRINVLPMVPRIIVWDWICYKLSFMVRKRRRKRIFWLLRKGRLLFVESECEVTSVEIVDGCVCTSRDVVIKSCLTLKNNESD